MPTKLEICVLINLGQQIICPYFMEKTNEYTNIFIIYKNKLMWYVIFLKETIYQKMQLFCARRNIFPLASSFQKCHCLIGVV